MEILAKASGILGVMLITWGIYVKKEINQDYVFAAGGLALLMYSLYLRDPIFIPLQIIFTLASVVEIIKIRKHKK